jgi:hypothetical protein
MVEDTCFICRRLLPDVQNMKDGSFGLLVTLWMDGCLSSGTLAVCRECGKKKPFPKLLEEARESHKRFMRRLDEISSKGSQCGDG